MTIRSTRTERIPVVMGSVESDADVLVIGGGPAGTWAAISAAERGARVVLADKGFCGTSGATAAAGTGVWYVDPDPVLREAAMANRETALPTSPCRSVYSCRLLSRSDEGLISLAIAWA